MRISAKTIVELAGFDIAKVTSAWISNSKFNDLDTVVNAKPGSELKVRIGKEEKTATVPAELSDDQKNTLEVANAKRAEAIKAKNEKAAEAKKAAAEKK